MWKSYYFDIKPKIPNFRIVQIRCQVIMHTLLGPFRLMVQYYIVQCETALNTVQVRCCAVCLCSQQPYTFTHTVCMKRLQT